MTETIIQAIANSLKELFPKFNIYDYVEKKERIEKALKKAKEIVKNEKGIFKLVEVNFGTYQYTQLFLNEIEIKGEKE